MKANKRFYFDWSIYAQKTFEQNMTQKSKDCLQPELSIDTWNKSTNKEVSDMIMF